MFGISSEVFAFLLVGLLACLFLKAKNGLVHMIAAVVFGFGVAPLVVAVIERHWTLGSPAWFGALLMVFVASLLGYLAHVVTAPPEVTLSN